MLAPGLLSRQTELTVAAEYLGIPLVQLRRELRADKSLAQVVKRTPGKSEAGLIIAIERHRTGRSGKAPEGQVKAQVRAPGRQLLKPILPLREDAREYLGLTIEQLRSREAAGESLAQIATATPGKSTAGLINAMFADRKEQLLLDVKAGRLKAQTERQSLARLRARLQSYVARRFRARG